MTLLENISDTIRGEFVYQTCDEKHCLPIFSKRFELVFTACNHEENKVILEQNSIVKEDSKIKIYITLILGGAFILALLLWVLKEKNEF